VGLKIDFFESDKAQRMAQYDMLAEMAATYRLMLNFHGATKPAGEIRTWPHVLTREGVMGGEYLQRYATYLPGGPDATHHCTLPFTRNAVGPMDFTPVVYNTYRTGTTDCHQTALAVIFLSYIQHIGEGAEHVLRNPCRPFLSRLPADWDEGILLEGYPASHVTMARRKGKDWFIGGICARRPRNAKVNLSFLGRGKYVATLYRDDMGDLRAFDAAIGALPAPDKGACEWLDAQRQRPTLGQHDLHRTLVETKAVNRADVLTVPMCVNGGFVMHLARKASTFEHHPKSGSGRERHS
jgi:alpha-glucosidase